MNRDERNIAVATMGLALAAFGAFLPWARIGGRNRSGFNTADTFISLADGALPNQVAWVGRWWYLPAFLALVAWASTFLAGRAPLRAIGVMLVLLAVAMWWLFVWAGESYNLLDMRLVGPAVATVGLLILGQACARRRASMVKTPPPDGPFAPNE